MLLHSTFFALVVVVAYGASVHHHGPTTTPAPDAVRLQKLEAVSEQLARQLMLQQLYVEEKTRSEGDSGIKQTRMRKNGMHPFHTATVTDHSVAAIHDHSNLERTVGMGELVAVLNGLEFRTRHNDYKLRMPVHNKTYNMIEDIPFPPVPPSVLHKSTVEEQSAELREYFKAFKDANTTHRDYRPYFKPILCYLEGAWTLDKNLEEPFVSDRHKIEASSWFDLQEKIRFTSMTGDRLNSQNFAYLPTTIFNVSEGIPTFAQWNYRILCHPLKAQVDVTHFRPVDDVAHRMAFRKDFNQYLQSRMVRFEVDEQGRERFYQKNELDDWMAEIPGKNNYGERIVDNVFGLSKVHVDNDSPLNVANYHRTWRVLEKDAMGDTVGHRGFADRNMFVAENTQPRIAPLRVKHCGRVNGRNHCEFVEKRMSYAIPLEVVFLTPLQTWNPYNINYWGKFKGPQGHFATDNHRNGGVSAEKAYNGSNSKAYYFTPTSFFSGQEVSSDPADTTRAATGVLDPQGNVQQMKSSGVRINLPNIAGVGSIRTRYPILPVYSEGSPIMKEVEALREILMDIDTNHKYLKKLPQGLHTYTAQPSHKG